LIGADHRAADHADRRALGVGAERAQRADRDADVDRAGDHRGQRLAAALGVEHLELEAALLEEALLLADLGHLVVESPAGANGDFQCVVGKRGGGGDGEGGDEDWSEHVSPLYGTLYSTSWPGLSRPSRLVWHGAQ
jgi:hypothetical protein